AVEGEVIFLYVFAVISLAVGQAEQAFFEDRIAAIPQGDAKTQELLGIADPGQSILAPAVCPRAGLVMTEVLPGAPIRAVVLANRSPLPLAEVGPPLLPRHARPASFLKPRRFCIGIHCLNRCLR